MWKYVHLILILQMNVNALKYRYKKIKKMAILT